jgi:tellurite resistance protein TerC
LIQRAREFNPERNFLHRYFQRFVPSVSEYRGSHFTVTRAGRRYATPLLLVLLTIEATDIIFAVDSIPAVFAITRDPFIVYTSNIFAILGLRALYFALAGLMEKFHYLRIGLALVLAFVGAKMMLANLYEVPIISSLVVIAVVLTGTVVASLIRPAPEHRSLSRADQRPELRP